MTWRTPRPNRRARAATAARGPREQGEHRGRDGIGDGTPGGVADHEPLAAEQRDCSERPHDRREITVSRGDGTHPRRARRRRRSAARSRHPIQADSNTSPTGEISAIPTVDPASASTPPPAGIPAWRTLAEEELEREARGEHARRGGDQRPAAVRAVDLVDRELGHIEARCDGEHAARPRRATRRRARRSSRRDEIATAATPTAAATIVAARWPGRNESPSEQDRDRRRCRLRLPPSTRPSCSPTRCAASHEPDVREPRREKADLCPGRRLGRAASNPVADEGWQASAATEAAAMPGTGDSKMSRGGASTTSTWPAVRPQ